MVSGETRDRSRLADNKPPHSNRRMPATVWIGTGVAIIGLVAASLKYSPHANAKPARTTPASLPHVVVSRPLVENLDTRLSFLGQFSAVSQVEVRAQVGGTLTGIFSETATSFRKEIFSSRSIRNRTRSRWRRRQPNSVLRQRISNWQNDNLRVPRICRRATLEHLRTLINGPAISAQR